MELPSCIIFLFFGSLPKLQSLCILGVHEKEFFHGIHRDSDKFHFSFCSHLNRLFKPIKQESEVDRYPVLSILAHFAVPS